VQSTARITPSIPQHPFCLQTEPLPEFWQQAHDRHPLIFRAAKDLEPLHNKVFKRRVTEPLHRILRMLAMNVSNSFGALITLVLNGYGSDAMRIARSMFEAEVTAAYLARHTEAARDYLDFHWVQQEKLRRYMIQFAPGLLEGISPERIEENQRQLKAIESRFRDPGGRLRNRWNTKTIREMAEEAGLGEIYLTFYSWASSMHHVDFGGLSCQVEKGTIDVDLAPSHQWADQALIAGYGAVLRTLECYNNAAQLGIDREIGTAVNRFLEAAGGGRVVESLRCPISQRRFHR